VKLLIVLEHVRFYRNIEPIVRQLTDLDHDVAILHGKRVKSPLLDSKDAERSKQPGDAPRPARRTVREKVLALYGTSDYPFWRRVVRNPGLAARLAVRVARLLFRYFAKQQRRAAERSLESLRGNERRKPRERDPQQEIDRDRKRTYLQRSLEAAESVSPNVTAEYRPIPPELAQRALRRGREVVNRAMYLRPGHPAPDRVGLSLEASLPIGLRALTRRKRVQRLLRRPGVLTAWRKVELTVPPSRTVLDILDRIDPDVVLVAPCVWPKRPVEADYIRAAKSREIRTIGYVNSWDNLTSKGTVQVLPDALVVWNEEMAQEAVELHDVPRDVVQVVGAPHLDRLFELCNEGTRVDLRQKMGAAANKPYVLYLCSSRTLIASEVEIVDGIADALAERLAGNSPTIVVRPHPLNATVWDEYSRVGVAIYPREGNHADTDDSWRDYFHQLSGASCFVGLNTTAFLEAAVVDRPCLSIVSDRFHAAQGYTGHFRHLLKADFLQLCSDMDELALAVEDVLRGEDMKREKRRRFVESFLRPAGIDVSATDVVVNAILDAAEASRLSMSARSRRASFSTATERKG
jgi:hypothetical protein